MKARFLLVLSLLLCLPVLAQQGGTSFQSQTGAYTFAATSSAGTAFQVTGNNFSGSTYLVQNTGVVGVWFVLAPSQSAAASITIPSGGTPGGAYTYYIEAGRTKSVVGPPQAWFNAETTSSTATVYVTGGFGADNGAVSSIGTGPPTTVCSAGTVLAGPAAGLPAQVACINLTTAYIPVIPDTNISLSTSLLGQNYQSGLNGQLAADDTAITCRNYTITCTSGTNSLTIGPSVSNSTVSAGATTTLTSLSSQTQVLTGSSSQTYKLPDATTLDSGAHYYFNNNSSGTLTVVDNSSTTIGTVPAGGYSKVNMLTNSVAAGTWDIHPQLPGTFQVGSGATGLWVNNILNTTAQIGSGASSCTAPNFVPQRVASTTGVGGDGSSVCVAVGGAQTFKSTATQFIVNNQFSITGNLSAANPQLNGFGMDGSPTPTFTDTTATGTTANEALYSFPQATLNSSGAATFTNVYDLYVPNALCQAGNPTCPGRFSIGTGGGIRVGTGGITIAGGGFFVSGGSTFNGSATFGSSTALTLSSGEIGLIKIAASGTAPGAAGAKLSFVCGTAAGSVKLISYAGTSTTPVTITDNIGSGVTGC